MPRPSGSEFRRHWCLDPAVVFLNHGSFGACPRPILEKQARWRAELEAEPVQFLVRRFDENLAPVRAALAAFLGARTRDVVFVANATAAVNAVMQSTRLEPGDEILVTSHAYNACRNAAEERARRAGARVVVAEIPFPLRHADEIVAAILGAVTVRTRLAMIDHVTSATALVLPVDRLLRALEPHGIDVLIDGAHAPGMVPLNLAELRPSYYAGNLHKWVCAPKGAGFLWVREDKQSGMHPTVVSHGYNTPWPGENPLHHRFDWTGTFDPTAWLCVGDAIAWLGGLLPGGWPELMRHNRELAALARRHICTALGVEPPCPEAMLGAMASVALPPRLQHGPWTGVLDRDQLALYDRCGIEALFTRHGVPERRWLRLSAQVYNAIAEYDFLAAAIAELP